MILVRNVHDFEKFTIFSAFVIIIAGSCDSVKLMKKEMLSYHLPKPSTQEKTLYLLIDYICIANSVAKER